MIKFKRNINWSITDKDKASVYNLGILKVRKRGSGGILLINTENIPPGMTIADYVEFLVENGIIVQGRKKKNSIDNRRAH